MPTKYYNFIQDLKKEIIIAAEGPETKAVQGDVIIIEEVKKIDENNVPSQILIGSNEKGKANTLKALINDYREFLISTLDGKNPSAEDALRKSLNTDDGKDPDGQTIRLGKSDFSDYAAGCSGNIIIKISGGCQKC